MKILFLRERSASVATFGVSSKAAFRRRDGVPAMMNTAALGLVLFQLVSSHGSAKPAAPISAAANSAAGVTWTVPKAWLVVPSSSAMRFATYKVAAAPGDNEAGEVSVFVFGKGDGGSVDSNVA